MDKINKLKALTGDEEVSVDRTTSGKWGYNVKARHIYEGTDSEEEDEEEIPLRRKTEPESISRPNHPDTEHARPANDFKEYQLQQGQLAAERERFVPWQAIKKYPYSFIGRANRELVSKNYFDQGKVYKNVWDFFYLYRLPPDLNQAAILLVPTRQFESFLETINRELGVHLRLPSGPANNSGFRVAFPNEGTPRPRYLGRAMNRDMADRLHTGIPSSSFRLDGEPDAIENPSQGSLVAFKDKIDSMMRAHQKKKAAKKEKKQVERAVQQESWNQPIQRVQRYLGMREQSLAQRAEIVRARLQKENLHWMDYDDAFRDAMANLPPPKDFNVENPAPYKQDGSVVFVCVDVEAYERNTRQITEIGIATLDTEDLESLSPGAGGVNWRKMIRARHFRIYEHKHLQNTEFVDGCADRFEFGESEFINLKHAPHVVSTCFKHPFSKQGVEPSTEEGQKRNIVLVGHDVQADIRFLTTIGYDISTLSNLVEIADTSSMWRYLKEENNPRNLATILAELGIIAWNLHNAGNDAVYTLQALISIAIKALTEESEKISMEKEKENRAAESVNEDNSDEAPHPFPAKSYKEAADAQPVLKKYLEGLQPPLDKGWDSATQPSDDPRVQDVAWKTELFTIEDTA